MDADQLYGLPLDQFVAERGALARELRADGQRERAAEVTALRKPSAAAWAVNQLVRTQRRDVDGLFAAGDRLREVQAAVMDGREDAQALRGAAGEERAAVDALIESARGLLTSGGHELSSTVLDRVTDTLHAAALDDDARAAVGDGRLERELRHIGLGGGGLASPSASKRPGRKPQAPAKTSRAANQDEDVSQRRADAKRAERDRADARRAARSAEADARREADRAGRALKIAHERRERAAQALADAEQELATATSQAQVAEEAHRRARDELDAF
jgi:hypothetical protein